ncbi:hypothetical protein A5780_33650 [Nocardia sp. 852002-20019_SCH5090214]|jgi:hypothetical protein|uniref:DUF2871 domain-containing protein n=1 Tax=Nocardia nova TaxID=37330 RepID=A0A2S6A013_9NOCA|nr:MULTISPECIES: DUF2871 domain-containing protein [Nocardia]OBF77555.1 hypothetical protein A9X06_23660 [Mycobacterium sp. 852002-51759_SCH5129042]MBF6277947.1 DUF2871 domain-containing protein [Nocardia nova]OBA47349.1 hypothetical protein A5780_33650 [Nocardia sp. 852002-20019_SCH5090214]OBA47403.1 hypothetical protein A5789_03415 [Nocardia sp. 852002-51101_SCH5132738]OBB44712.1 hypothetical protein A5748_27335 [Nocardia sp. 852002-51244_SCH5132740]
MKQLYWAAVGYTALGLPSGLVYRELTKAHQFTGKTELAVVHTHLLALGTLFFLIVLVLEHQLALSNTRAYRWFFAVYNIAVLWTVACMTIIGSRTVLGYGESMPLAELAGVGHVLLTIGFVLFFVAVHQAITTRREEVVPA